MNHDMLRALSESPWAVLPGTLRALTQIAIGEMGADVTALAQSSRPPQLSARASGNVGVLHLYGLLTHRTWIGWPGQSTSYQSFAGLFRQVLADPSVKAIVLDCASPGGEVAGCEELAAEIYASRGRKPTTASANAQMASAAYWVCSACDEVTITPSGEAGSIGAVIGHEDISKAMEMAGRQVTLIASSLHKTELSPFAPLSPEARAYLQTRVDEIGATFQRAIAKHRGVSVIEVRSNFGQGRMLSASNAVAAKLCDRIETLDQTIARLARGGGGASSMVRGSSALEMEQERRRRRLALASAGPSIAPAATSKPIAPAATPDEVGHEYGKMLSGDPYRLAVELGITLKVCSESEICAASGVTRHPGNALQGAANKATKTVYINATLTSWGRRETLAHECGHVLRAGWDEPQVVKFGEAFMSHSALTGMNENEKRQKQLRALHWTRT